MLALKFCAPPYTPSRDTLVFQGNCFNEEVTHPSDFHICTNMTTFLMHYGPGQGVAYPIPLLYDMGPRFVPERIQHPTHLVAGKRPVQRCFMFKGRGVPDTGLDCRQLLPCLLCPHPRSDHISLSPMPSCHPDGIPGFRQDGSPVPAALGIPKGPPSPALGSEEPDGVMGRGGRM